MLVQTRSSTPLSPVQVEPSFLKGGSHVWLRENIEPFEDEESEGWLADEVYFYSEEQLSVEDVTARFEEFWSQETQPVIPSLTDEEIVLALAELGSMVAMLGEM